MRRFTIKLGLFLLPILIIVGLTNFLIDPAQLFNNHYENGMVKIINDGYNVANTGNYDNRLFQKIYINKLSEAKDIIVIGSSRSMQVRDELFTDTFFNNSVPGAVIEDYIAITQLYALNDKLPQKVILGVDPWAFNINHGQERWKSYQEYYQSFMENNNIITEKIRLFFSRFSTNASKLLSVKYFQGSIEYFLFSDNNFDYFPTKKEKISSKIKLNDGSLIYDKTYRNVTKKEIERKAKNYINGTLYSIEDFSEINDIYLEQFKDLINFYKIKNVEVILYLPPYHPIVYDYIVNNKKYEMVKIVESYLKKFGFENNIQIIGSYNPNIFKLESKDFYDGMHPKEKAIIKLFD